MLSQLTSWVVGKPEVIQSDEKKSGFGERADPLAWLGRWFDSLL